MPWLADVWKRVANKWGAIALMGAIFLAGWGLEARATQAVRGIVEEQAPAIIGGIVEGEIGQALTFIQQDIAEAREERRDAREEDSELRKEIRDMRDDLRNLTDAVLNQ